MDLVPVDILGTKITIIGAGAIGGWTTLALAKMGFCDITVYDFDKVDTVNMNSQFFRFSDIGSAKVLALKSLVTDFTNTEITAKEERYENGIFAGIVISAVDSMAVRRTIWENHRDRGIHTKAVIDPRMGAEAASLFVARPLVSKDRADYEKSLYSDDEAVHERCTAKATIYTANMLSGLVVKAVKSLLTRKDYLRCAQWNIAEDDFLGFKATVA
jgi:molybdopterin/thiamine biosynthesis adenylyltransferase